MQFNPDDPLGLNQKSLNADDPLGLSSDAKSLAKWKLKGEQAAIANEEPSVLFSSPSALGKIASIESGRLASSLMKGVALMAEGGSGFEEFPTYKTDADIQALKERGETIKSPAKFRNAVVNNPVFKKAKVIDELSDVIYQSIPEGERDTVAAQLTWQAVGALPMATGAAAPAIFAISAAGDVFDRTYQEKIDSGLSPEKAASESAGEALASAAKEALLWRYAPQVLKKYIGKKIINSAGENAEKQWLAKTGTEAAEMGAVGGASQGVQNIIEDKPLGENVAQAALGAGVLGGVVGGIKSAIPAKEKAAAPAPLDTAESKQPIKIEPTEFGGIPKVAAESGLLETVAPDEGFDIVKMGVKPSQLQPALIVNGEPVVGGNTHAEVAANAATPEAKAALKDDANHVFVADSGEVLNREQAAKAVGETEPLHSEKLNELKAEERTTATDIKQAFEGISNASGAAFRENIRKRLANGERVTFTKPASIEAAKKNKFYKIKENPDGSVDVIEVLPEPTQQKPSESQPTSPAQVENQAAIPQPNEPSRPVQAQPKEAAVFNPGDELIMRSPYTGEDVVVNYRGDMPSGKSVVWTGKTQMTIPKEWLRKRGEEYQPKSIEETSPKKEIVLQEQKPVIEISQKPLSKKELIDKLSGQEPSYYAGKVKWNESRNALAKLTKEELSRRYEQEKKQAEKTKAINSQTPQLYKEFLQRADSAGSKWRSELSKIAQENDVSWTAMADNSKGEEASRLAFRIAEKKVASEKATETPLRENPVSDLPSTPQKYRVGTNPTLHTLVEKLPATKVEIENGEQPVRVKNDKTGEVFVVMESDLTPVKEKADGEKGAAKITKKELDALLKKQGLDPSAFPDTKSKKSALARADAKLAEIQKKIRGKNFTGITGLEPVIFDAAIGAARLALKATGSLVGAIEAAVAYIRKNHPDAKFDENEFNAKLAIELAPRQEFQRETAKPSTAGQWSGSPPIDYIPETHGGRNEFVQRIINHFGDTVEGLNAALRHLSAVRDAEGVVDSVRIIGGRRIEQLANEKRAAAKNPIEAKQWGDVARAGRELNQQIASQAGQALQAQAQVAREVRTPQDAVAHAEDAVRAIQEEVLPPTAPKSVVGALEEAGRMAARQLDRMITNPRGEIGARYKSFQNLIKSIGKGLGIDWRNIMESGMLSQEQAKQKIFNELKNRPQFASMSDAELRGIAENLDAAWREIRNQVFLREFDKLVGLPEVKKDVKKAIEQTLPEAVRMANLGTLNEPAVRDMLAKKLNLPMLDEATANRISELGKQIDSLLTKAGDSPEEVARKVQSLRNEVDYAIAELRAKAPLTSRAGRINFAKSANEYLVMQALGTLQFAGRQIFDVGGQSVLQAVSRAYASAIEGGGSRAQQARNFISELGQTANDLRRNIDEAVVHAKEGFAGRSLQYKNSLGFKSEMMLFERAAKNLKKALDEKNYGKATAYWLLGLIGTPRRYLAGMDEFAGTLTQNTELRQAVAEKAAQMGMSRKEANQWFNENAKDLAGNAVLIEQQLRTKYGSEWDKLPPNQRAAIVYDVVDAQLMRRIKSLGLDADAINSQVHETALAEAWNLREIDFGLGGLIGSTMERMKQAMESRGIPPLGTQFANSVAMGINRTLSTAGLGFFPSLFAHNKDASKMSPWFATEKQRQARKAEAALGLTVLAALTGLAGAGVMRVRNQLPKNPEERNKMIKEGRQGNSIEFDLGNGKFVTIGTGSGLLAPFRMAVSTIGAWQDFNEEWEKKQRGESEAAQKKGLVYQIEPKPLLTHIGTALGYGLASGLGGQRTVGGGLASLINPQTGSIDPLQPVIRIGTQIVPFLPMVKSAEKVIGGQIVDSKSAPWYANIAPVAFTGADKNWKPINANGDEVGLPAYGRVIGTLTGGAVPLVMDGKNYAKNDDLVALEYVSEWSPTIPSEKQTYATKDNKLVPMTPEQRRDFIIKRGQEMRKLIAIPETKSGLEQLGSELDKVNAKESQRRDAFRRRLQAIEKLAANKTLLEMGFNPYK